MSGAVECGESFEVLDLGEVSGFACFRESFFGAVESVDVSEVMFVVMQTHGLFVDVWFECVVGVGEFGKFVITSHVKFSK